MRGRVRKDLTSTKKGHKMDSMMKVSIGPEEKALLKEAATKAGMTLSMFIRVSAITAAKAQTQKAA